MKRLLLLLALLPSLASAAIIPTPLPFILQNGQTADATQVMSDFNTIVTNVNANAAAAATSAQTNVVNTFTQPQNIPAGTTLGQAANIGQLDQNPTKYVTDTGAANAYVVTPVPAWASYIGGSDIFMTVGVSNTNTTSSVVNVSGLGNKNILNEDGSQTEANALQGGRVYHLIYDGTEFLIIGKNNTAPTPATGDSSTKIATTAFVYQSVPAGVVMDFAGTSLPTGWLLCDGSSVLRAGTYAALFSAIGTTWGSVDGTHFNVPNLLGRTTIGSGTGATTEIATTSSANGFTVAANNTKWETGMPVVWSALSSFTTSGSAGPTYYAVRISSTNVRFATTLALAQNLTPDITISGSGSVTLTATFTARSIGEVGGEEAHAMSSQELLAHGNPGHVTSTGLVNAGSTATVPNSYASLGGNSAMNVMQPFAVVQKIIKY
jgi:microcystin-dependent protein